MVTVISYCREYEVDFLKKSLCSLGLQTVLPNRVIVLYDDLKVDHISSIISDFKTLNIEFILMKEAYSISILSHNTPSIVMTLMSPGDVFHPEKLQIVSEVLKEDSTIPNKTIFIHLYQKVYGQFTDTNTSYNTLVQSDLSNLEKNYLSQLIPGCLSFTVLLLDKIILMLFTGQKLNALLRTEFDFIYMKSYLTQTLNPIRVPLDFIPITKEVKITIQSKYNNICEFHGSLPVCISNQSANGESKLRKDLVLEPDMNYQFRLTGKLETDDPHTIGCVTQSLIRFSVDGQELDHFNLVNGVHKVITYNIYNSVGKSLTISVLVSRAKYFLESFVMIANVDKKETSLKPVEVITDHLKEIPTRDKQTVQNNKSSYAFNWKIYMELNFDLRKGKMKDKSSLKGHYKNIGIKEDRPKFIYDVYPDFNYETYLELNQDLKQHNFIKEQLEEHWVLTGRKEGRNYKKLDFIPSFHVLIATIGRKTIIHQLRALLPQLMENDNLTIVFDGPESTTYLEMVTEFVKKFKCKSVNIIVEDKNLGSFGHGIRNKHNVLEGDYVMHADDDDFYLPGTFKKLRNLCNEPNSIYICMFESMSGTTVFDTEFEIGSVGTASGIIPTKYNNQASWGMKYGGDGEFYVELSNKFGKNFVFVPVLIYTANICSKHICNWDVYKELNLDLKMENLEQYKEHWKNSGFSEGRCIQITDAYPDFDWEKYKEQNPSLKLDGQVDYELHWIRNIISGDKITNNNYKQISGRKKNIIFVSPVYLIGGVEFWIVNLAKELKEKYNFSILITGNSKDKNMITIAKVHATVYENIDTINPKNFDLAIHVIDIYTNYDRFFIKNIFVGHLNINDPYKCHIDTMIYVSISPLKSYSIVPYNKTIKIINNCYLKEKIVITKVKSDLLNELGITYDKKIVLFIGRFEPEKRPLMFAEVIRLLPENFIGVMLGNGSQFKLIENYINSNSLQNKLILKGFQFETGNYYNIANYYVSSSEYECFQLTVTDAIISKIPIIMTQVGLYYDIMNDISINTVDRYCAAIDIVNKIMFFENNKEVSVNQVNKLYDLFINLCNPTKMVHRYDNTFKSYLEPVKSYDMFDTLLARKCKDPHTIHDIVGKKNNINNFKELRINAELQSNGTFNDIYVQLQQITKYNNDLINQLKESEIQTETDMLFPIVENMSKIENGDIIVSDMYYDCITLLDILNHHGLKKEVTVYVSSSGKRDGSIWRKVLSNHTIISHIGDNKISDIQVPKSLGIETIYTDLHEYTFMENLLGNTNVELANFMRFIRLNNPYDKNNYKYTMWFEQCQYNIPLLIYSSIRIKDVCYDNGYNNILFSSRDCCHLIHIFNKLYNGLLRTEYFHASRKIYYNPSDEYIEYVKKLYTDTTLIVDLQGTAKSGIYFFYDKLKIKHNRFTIYFRNEDTSANIKDKVNIYSIYDKGSSSIEYLNYDMIGTLIDYKERDIRSVVEYDINLVDAYHKCIGFALKYINEFELKGVNIPNDSLTILYDSIEKSEIPKKIIHIDKH